MQPNSDFESEPLDEAIDEALEGSLRSDQWKKLVGALRIRHERLQRDLELSDDKVEREELEERLREVEEQISVLSEEASLTSFVEDSVKFSYEIRGLTQD